jgi:eukaryotic-like serine/threonine-protein kinase
LRATLGASFEVVRELSGAGMSRVFIARDLRLRREIVVKVLPPDIAAGVKVNRFLREIEIAARLQHPHIVPVLSANSASDILYYTMPFIEGASLGSALKTRKLDTMEVLSILRDVADALSYAHEHGVVHRDVKPDNILLQKGHALVVDFGVAKAISEAVDETTLTGTGLTLGTPMYMAPEQAAAGEVDGRSDIYSLGVVGYEALCGTPLFAGPSPQALMAAHVVRAPEPLLSRAPHVDKRIADIVMRCLEKNPNDRWQTASDLCEALNSVGARFTPAAFISAEHAETADASAAPAPSFLRSRLFRAAALVGGAALIGAASFLATRPSETTPETVAVLPFRNLDANPETNYFAEGMAQEIRNALIKVEGINVASATSSAAVRERKVSTREIGRTLKVSNLLEGSVRHAGNRIIVNAQLTNAKTGYQTWSSNFEDDAANISAVQSRIATAIANALVGRVSARKGHKLRQRPINLAAYDLLQQGRFMEGDFERANLEKAISLYERAIIIDPRYAEAYVAIADANYHLADDYLPPRVAYPRVRNAAIRAIQLDSTLATAFASLASYEVSYGWDWKNAKANIDRALALDPQSSFAHMIAGWYHVIVGEPDKAIKEAIVAASLDPLSDEIGGNVVSILRSTGRHDLAIAQIRQLMTSSVGAPDVLHAWMAWEYTQLNELERARAHVDSALAITPGCCKRTRAMFLAHLGDTANARKLVAEVEAQRKSRYYRAEFLAEARSEAGDTTAALNWLDSAYADRSSGFPYFRFSSALSKLENHARYAELVARLRLPPANALN